MRVLVRVALLGALFSNIATAADVQPIPCRYNEDDGRPTQLFERPEAGPNDWYSRYRAIQFCARLNGEGSYVLIEEELTNGFRVLNPARSILATTQTSPGLTSYMIADASDQVVLNLNSANQTLDVFGVWGSSDYHANLKLVWSQGD